MRVDKPPIFLYDLSLRHKKLNHANVHAHAHKWENSCLGRANYAVTGSSTRCLAGFFTEKGALPVTICPPFPSWLAKPLFDDTREGSVLCRKTAMAWRREWNT